MRQDPPWHRPDDLVLRRTFARNLRAARTRAGLTQADVAEAVGLTETVYGRYERAKLWPSLGTLCRLCEVLDCSADILLGRRPPSPADEAEVPPAPPEARRLLRLLRGAHVRTIELADWLLGELGERLR
ncbi:helix-turn-helix domain-containing protein [Haliangium sp.]|uniref:helix-turn-helix domain-containing protein n=1 Tax=Haliangium sp. TaxID=2663208 RepID=UPI003D0AFFFC